MVQTDAYAGYNPVLLPDAVRRLACMAHIRRKFVDGRDLAPVECDRVLKQIAKLYELEERWRLLSPAVRLEERQRKAKPVFEELRAMVMTLAQRLLPRHGLQEALGSMMACCRLNKVNPRDWLADVLRRLPAYPVNRVAELLPHRWQKSAAQ